VRLWAAIDLMGGSAVTLVQGRETDKTQWKQDPVELAERWQSEGADGLHIIDLDAAFGKGSNRETILKIIEKARVPVQVGGGIRTEEIARGWLEGANVRTVIGTMAYKEPETLGKLLGDYGAERIVIAADYRDGEVVAKGWKEGHGISVEKAAEEMERRGVRNLLATSVGRDGMRSGPDVETVGRLVATRKKLNVIASGGIRDVADLASLEARGAAGAVIGRALYEETLRLQDAKRRPT